MKEREVVRESEPVATEREVVVDDRPRRGGGGGAIAAIVAVLLVLILAWFLLQALNIFGDAAEEGGGVNVDPNAEVEVDG
ncbi:MAG: hypothetical protein GEU74_01220 [Nitriliruptorales bacterium]|nr:hypothetical protein [Nitriliruptorales bacterium]